MAVNVSPFGPKPQFELSSGAPAVGNLLFFYVAGSTSTKQNTYTDSTGGVANSNPIVLNSLGQPTNEIWFTAGQSYKVVYAPSTDTDPPTSPIWTVDHLSGINDTTVTIDQWVAGPTPTFVNATSFTLVGDQTSTFHIGRRLKSINSGGTVYSTITNSVFGALTTVTVSNDASTLDAGLSAVSYGLLTDINHSVPSFRSKGDILSQSAAGTISRIAAGTDGYQLLPSIASTSGLTWSGPGMALWNGTLTASQNATVLTVAIKTVAGADPSDNDPVFVFFRNATSKTGDVTIIKINAATSIATTVGGTFGVANTVPFRLWVVGFNDSGTFRLALINCLTTVAGAGAGRDVTAIFPLAQFAVASATQIGAGSTSAGVFYSSGAAVASKAYATLAHLTYESGLAAAGTFGVDQSRLDLFRVGTPLPGQIIQTAGNDTGAVATGATSLPVDNTIPQSTEGDQYMSQAITPGSAANVLWVVTQLALASNGAGDVGAALFQDATANALAACSFTETAASRTFQLGMQKKILASGTAATTFKVRAGEAGATTTFNGAAGGQYFLLTNNSYIDVRELMA